MNTYVDTAFRHEGKTTLRVRGLVFTQIFEFIVLIFVVPNVTVTVEWVSTLILLRTNVTSTYPFPARYRHLEPSSESPVSTSAPVNNILSILQLTPERHANTRNRVNHSEPANGLSPSGLPESNLSLTHPGETSGGKPVMFAHPDGSAVFGTSVSSCLVHRSLLADIPDTDLLVTRGGYEHASARVPRQALYDIGVLQGQGGLAGRDVPELDREVT